MKILDRAALVIGAAGMWLYMASVEQDRWSRAVLSVVLAFVLKKISDRIAECREEQEEREEEHRNRAFTAWIRTGSLKG